MIIDVLKDFSSVYRLSWLELAWLLELAKTKKKKKVIPKTRCKFISVLPKSKLEISRAGLVWSFPGFLQLLILSYLGYGFVLIFQMVAGDPALISTFQEPEELTLCL